MRGAAVLGMAVMAPRNAVPVRNLQGVATGGFTLAHCPGRSRHHRCSARVAYDDVNESLCMPEVVRKVRCLKCGQQHPACGLP